MPHDGRDAQFAEAIISALASMIVAVEHDDAERATRELGKLLAAIVDHKKAMAGRAGDEGLRRAVAALNRTEHA